MKTSIAIGAANSGKSGEFESLANYTVEAEKIGVDSVWSAEAWGQDAVAPLAYLAARTSKIKLGTGIMQVTARAPSMTAMTALTMATLSNNRFILGLGNSGPQVVEGLHGRRFDKPLPRMREAIAIIRQAFRGEKIELHGDHYDLPLPGGQGKSLRLSQPANPDIPIYLATLTPKALELTGEIADGWLGTSFTPEGAEAYLPHLKKGAEKAGRSLSDINISVSVPVSITSNPEPFVHEVKMGLAFQLGAMGSPTTNFYNDGFKRGGFEEDAIAVQKLWVEGKRDEAIARVPDDLVEKTSLIGSTDFVKTRIQSYRDVGVNTLGLRPLGKGAIERLDTLAAAVDLAK